MLIGHRGHSMHFPENTMLAFKNVNSKSIEFDVRKTRDNIPVVLHDCTLERTTTGNGSIKDMDWNDLQKVSIRNTSENIPSLERVFQELGSEYFYDVEIKTRDTASLVVDAIRASGIPKNNFLITSFKWDEIATVRELDEEIFTGLISVVRPALAIRKAFSIGCKVVVLNHRVVTKNLIRYASECDMKVFAYTVNDPIEIRKLFLFGVAAVITDDPNQTIF
ncbi:glycerophosphoryl diester phosphodiesterase [Paramecium bursaria Chlorella virus NE-JV-1]|nr:glycerophosphoryl diester phosphodiesterase [Paramecium bursaria Chlorella virus NE-JV-1]